MSTSGERTPMQASDIPPAGIGLQCKIPAVAAVGEGSKCSRTDRGRSAIPCGDPLMCFFLQNDALQRELDDLRDEKEQRERELQDENAELQGNVAKMRAELEAIMKELQDLMDTKLGLELEIAAYRKLLEGEENR